MSIIPSWVVDSIAPYYIHKEENRVLLKRKVCYDSHVHLFNLTTIFILLILGKNLLSFVLGRKPAINRYSLANYFFLFLLVISRTKLRKALDNTRPTRTDFQSPPVIDPKKENFLSFGSFVVFKNSCKGLDQDLKAFKNLIYGDSL